MFTIFHDCQRCIIIYKPVRVIHMTIGMVSHDPFIDPEILVNTIITDMKFFDFSRVDVDPGLGSAGNGQK